MKNLITILCLCSFLISSIDVPIEISNDNSIWSFEKRFSLYNSIKVSNKFINLTDKEITYLKYEINLYDKNETLIQSLSFDYNSNIILLSSIKPNKSKYIQQTVRNINTNRNNIEKIRVRVTEVEFSDGTTNLVPTNLVEITRLVTIKDYVSKKEFWGILLVGFVSILFVGMSSDIN